MSDETMKIELNTEECRVILALLSSYRTRFSDSLMKFTSHDLSKSSPEFLEHLNNHISFLRYNIQFIDSLSAKLKGGDQK